MVTSKRIKAKGYLPRLLLPTPEFLRPCQPTPPHETLLHWGVALVQFPVESLLLPLSLGACKALSVPSKTGVCFPSPMEVLWKWKSNSTCLQGQIPWGFPVPLSGPQAGKLDMVFWTFTTVGELLWDYCSPVYGSLTQWVWDLSLLWLSPSYHLAMASCLSLDMGYLFGRFQHYPVYGCSIAGCDFGALAGGGDCSCLYSIILNWKSILLILKLP